MLGARARFRAVRSSEAGVSVAGGRNRALCEKSWQAHCFVDFATQLVGMSHESLYGQGNSCMDGCCVC